MKNCSKANGKLIAQACSYVKWVCVGLTFEDPECEWDPCYFVKVISVSSKFSERRGLLLGLVGPYLLCSSFCNKDSLL
jgi:hypothetical protein